MDTTSLKQKYRRFKQWQREPLHYHDSGDTHRCCNCGIEFQGNYCHSCGQKATMGTISWHSVWQGIADVWGLGGRSLPRSLWYLLCRPGYLMSDYINGKCQASFPPVKMMVIVGAIFVTLSWIMDYETFEQSSEPITSTGFYYYYDRFFQILENNIIWEVLFMLMFLIIPTWFVFRHSPRNPHHTLPQGFYIQVFIATQFMLMIGSLTFLEEFLHHIGINDISTDWIMILFVPFMFIDYKQLFGYNWWGTLWRIVAAVFLAIGVAKLIVYTGGAFYGMVAGDGALSVRYLLSFSNHFALLWLALEAVMLVNAKPWCEGIAWSRILLRSLVAVAALSLTTAACGQLGIENSLTNMINSMQTMFLPD